MRTIFFGDKYEIVGAIQDHSRFCRGTQNYVGATNIALDSVGAADIALDYVGATDIDLDYRFVTLVLLVSQSDISPPTRPPVPPHNPFEMPFATNSVL